MGVDVLVTRIDPICDFCSSPDVVIAYPIEDFILPEFCWGSTGAFAACKICMTLIENNRKSMLMERSTMTMCVKVNGIPESLAYLFIKRLHEEFWKRLLRV